MENYQPLNDMRDFGVCWNCGKQGHTSKRCPRQRKNLVDDQASRIVPSDHPHPGFDDVERAIFPDDLCFNCWETDDHVAPSCPKPRLSIVQRERLRKRKGVPMTYLWSEILERREMNILLEDENRAKRIGKERRLSIPRTSSAYEPSRESRTAYDDDDDEDGAAISRADAIRKEFFKKHIETHGVTSKAEEVDNYGYDRRSRRFYARYCWNCWGTDHLQDECPSPKTPPYASDNLRVRLGIERPKVPVYDKIMRRSYLKTWPATVCNNCWETFEHRSRDCPKPYLNTLEREKRRVALGIDLTSWWRLILRSAGVEPIEPKYGNCDDGEDKSYDDKNNQRNDKVAAAAQGSGSRLPKSAFAQRSQGAKTKKTVKFVGVRSLTPSVVSAEDLIDLNTEAVQQAANSLSPHTEPTPTVEQQDVATQTTEPPSPPSLESTKFGFSQDAQDKVTDTARKTPPKTADYIDLTFADKDDDPEPKDTDIYQATDDKSTTPITAEPFPEMPTLTEDPCDADRSASPTNDSPTNDSPDPEELDEYLLTAIADAYATFCNTRVAITKILSEVDTHVENLCGYLLKNDEENLKLLFGTEQPRGYGYFEAFHGRTRWEVEFER